MATATLLAQAHRHELSAISAAVTSGVASVALGADPAAIDTWFFSALDGLLTRVQAGYARSRRSGSDYLRRQATLAGASVDVRTASLSLDQARTSLRVTGPVAFKQAIAAGMDEEQAVQTMSRRMSGAAQRLAIAGDRDVLEQTMRYGDGVVGYRRTLGGPGCGFCAMLASRGAVYLSERSASRTKDGLRYHDHCRCSPEPLFGREPEPAHVLALQRQWRRVTAGLHGAKAAAAWRRYWEENAARRLC